MKHSKTATLICWILFLVLLLFVVFLTAVNPMSSVGNFVESAAMHILLAAIVAALTVSGVLNHFVFVVAELFSKIIPSVSFTVWVAAIYILLFLVAVRVVQSLSVSGKCRQASAIFAVSFFCISVFAAGLFSVLSNRSIFIASFLLALISTGVLFLFLQKVRGGAKKDSIVSPLATILFLVVFIASLASTASYLFGRKSHGASISNKFVKKTIYNHGAYDAADFGNRLYILAGMDRKLYVSTRENDGAKWRRLSFVKGGKPEIIELSESGREIYITGKPKGNNRVPAVYRISARPFGLISALRDRRAGMVIDIDVDEKRHCLYLLNEFGKKLLVYDSRNMKLKKEIIFDNSRRISWPYAVKVDSGAGVIYVSSFLVGNRLYRIDANTNKVSHRFLPSLGIAIDDRRGFVYAARPILGRIDVLDVATLRTVAQIPAGAAVRNIEISPCGKFLFVGDFIKGTVEIIDLDLRKSIAILEAGRGLRGIHYNAINKTLIVSTSEKVLSYDLKGLAAAVKKSKTLE